MNTEALISKKDELIRQLWLTMNELSKVNVNALTEQDATLLFEVTKHQAIQDRLSIARNTDIKITPEMAAREFANVLHSWLSPENFAEMRIRNRDEYDMTPGVCASHEFCDANMAMDKALRNLGLSDLLDAEVAIIENTNLLNLWNAATEIAKHQYLKAAVDEKAQDDAEEQ